MTPDNKYALNEAKIDVSFANLEQLIEENKDAEVKKILNASRSLMKFVDDEGHTLLHAATKHKNLAIMDYLISEGCEVDVKTTSGVTPLMIAADSDEPALSIMLLDNDADIFATKFEGRTALQIYLNSLSCRRLPIIEAFCQKLKSKNINTKDLFAILEKGECRLDELVHLRNVEVTKMFLDKQLNYFDNRQTDGTIFGRWAIQVVKNCLEFGYVENLRVILQYGTNAEWNQEIFIGIFPTFTRECETDVFLKNIANFVQILIDLNFLKKGSIWDIRDLFLKSNERSLSELLKTDLNSYIKKKCGSEVLGYVFGNSNPGIFKLIQKEKLDEKLQGSCREIALGLAAFHKVTEHVKYLLEKNFDPNMGAPRNPTSIFNVLYEQAHPNSTACLKLLLQYNADTQVCTHYGITCVSCSEYSDENKKTLQIVLAHLALLKTCGITIKAPFIKFINSHENFIKIYKTACLQLKQMKSHKIHRSLTLFATLTRSYDFIPHSVKTMRLETVTSLCSSANNNLGEYNDYYIDIIRDRLMLAYKIHQTRNEAAAVICDYIHQLKGYLVVVDKICSFINYVHLHKIVHPSHDEKGCKKCKVPNLTHYQFVKASQETVE